MGTLQARINWSGLPCSPSGDLPNPGVKPKSPALQADSLTCEPQGKPMLANSHTETCWPGQEHRVLSELPRTDGSLSLKPQLNAALEGPEKGTLGSQGHDCDPMDYSPPGSSVPGILQARILEWAAVSSSRRSSRPNGSPALQVDSFPAAPPGKAYSFGQREISQNR